MRIYTTEVSNCYKSGLPPHTPKYQFTNIHCSHISRTTLTFGWKPLLSNLGIPLAGASMSNPSSLLLPTALGGDHEPPNRSAETTSAPQHRPLTAPWVLRHLSIRLYRDLMSAHYMLGAVLGAETTCLQSNQMLGGSKVSDIGLSPNTFIRQGRGCCHTPLVINQPSLCGPSTHKKKMRESVLHSDSSNKSQLCTSQYFTVAENGWRWGSLVTCSPTLSMAMYPKS